MGGLVYGVVRGFECGLECDFYGSGCAQESCVSIGLFQVVLPFCAYRGARAGFRVLLVVLMDSVANDGDPGNGSGDDCKPLRGRARLPVANDLPAHGFTNNRGLLRTRRGGVWGLVSCRGVGSAMVGDGLPRGCGGTFASPAGRGEYRERA